MFNNLKETIISLNNGAKNIANCEKAKQLKKKLLCIGLPLAIIGFVGVFICFILFSTAGFDDIGPNGFSNRILIPFILFIPFGVLGSIGTTITSYGLKIVITTFTTNLINEAIGNNCPKCGDEITPSEDYCSKCGERIKKECKNCKHINNAKADYCEKCGNKL